MRTDESQSNTPGLRLVGGEESGSVLINSGLPNPASTIGRRTQSQVPEVSLNSLESDLTTLEYKYLEVLDMLTDAIKTLVALTNSLSSTDTTRQVEDNPVI